MRLQYADNPFRGRTVKTGGPRGSSNVCLSLRYSRTVARRATPTSWLVSGEPLWARARLSDGRQRCSPDYRACFDGSPCPLGSKTMWSPDIGGEGCEYRERTSDKAKRGKVGMLERRGRNRILVEWKDQRMKRREEYNWQRFRQGIESTRVWQGEKQTVDTGRQGRTGKW